MPKLAWTPMRIMLLCAGLVFGGILAYLTVSSYFMSLAMKRNQMPPITVSAMKVKSTAWQARLHATGTLKAINGVDVTTEISGLVKSIFIDSGSEVKKGDVIIELNADTEIAQLQALEAQAHLAQITYERDKKQLDVQAISKATVDVDEADLKNKRAL